MSLKLPQSQDGFLPRKISYPLILIYCSLPMTKVSRATSRAYTVASPSLNLTFASGLRGQHVMGRSGTLTSSTALSLLLPPDSPTLPRTSLLLFKPKTVATLGEVSCGLLQSPCAASVACGCSHFFAPALSVSSPCSSSMLFKLCILYPGPHFLSRACACISSQQWCSFLVSPACPC